ncbi:bifunctional alpha,alpha-trehalose-phosphate synthase (UDP-forming)/trehalose-phosphatase [Subsaximicrobium wynnwilliamsii]|uniref:Alpha,alpha-trehalose-phosphate synthase n=1 Tax=Subsaximicrobium wynnwilliamsii TaxID=291179 RepID=A0A5C6ZKY8_9FLAO|nr:bifunctional alpha,alpha-trehalose-phosphate synthase (UDP-forming)/trehalose-phosphatase [Subsaximicrobium wynnwilliamsii]TXD84818.1 bifunctional alpha,alpha-trehalose-phosphate synthase (UDP-forming)/trehalose-phosphatase [Subsaximicrobium wynnwilliamsii]TXD90489.1 bifunctional alpha,alpha-trehalose-phosphate synthase (UDP-forming)/trehalose-phosphatase [Subsaximicrobium wynnwilliamsii]TXE04964.1 bifunctional alpha,alpha-trehalose-phosphate synthase (UDP-forming)/trehalose-phosphatase [Subs
MNKTIIVSNRLPLQIKIENDQLEVTPSVGGLATGLKSVHNDGKSLWIGWSGLTEEELSEARSKEVKKLVTAAKCDSVSLTQDDLENFYYGFSNRTLWPLFHYFMEYTEFDNDYWESYKAVNQKFADKVLEHLEDGDTVWVHDYQLLLLPKLIKEKMPNTTIGFFLHIPYPSYEIFRTFPWREELLHGMLGADLIGFHTYDYERHFLSSVKRILRLEVNFNEVTYHDRIVKVDSFPMGIDYDKFHDSASKHKTDKKSELQQRLDDHIQSGSDAKMILSIDRMDYTKGIPNRIRAFEYFLNKYPEYKEKVRLIMLAVPSRSNVPQYQKLKRDTDELVGRINGQFSTVSWTPIWYFYRSMPFENLIDLYTSSHVAMITPVRDGMNLVAKEYVATRTEQDGVLILSEMAGASKEMNESMLINPNNFEHIADTIKYALEMPLEEQKSRMKILQKRLKRYTVEKWAEEFMKSLHATKHLGAVIVANRLEKEIENNMLTEFNSAERRLFLLDYDGTLVAFKDNPIEASPDEQLYQLLDTLSANNKNDVVLISGRDRETFTHWFANKEYTLITDHGVWLKEEGKDWEALERLKNGWMENIKPILETFVDRTPGTFIEEKKYSLAWHYRKADPELAQIRTIEIDTVLTSLISNNDLSVLKGNKVIEIKSSSVNKGRASSRLLANNDYDFIFCIGDDWTDEYMFQELPKSAYTVKVGFKKTSAKYYVKDTDEVREVLHKFMA